jgi:hypothetical protein
MPSNLKLPFRYYVGRAEAMNGKPDGLTGYFAPLEMYY